MKKTITGILSAVMAAVLLTTTASGAKYSNNTAQEQETQTSDGTYCKNAITGETYYIPEPEIEAYSDETFGYSPGYDPYANEDNSNNSLVQPYMTDTGRTLVETPQNNIMNRSTVYIEAKIINENGNEETISGTGFMIGPNAVATCGHLLFNKDEFYGDHWITESLVIPSCHKENDKIQTPYGTAKGIAYYCGGKWAKNSDSSDDWGIIELDSNIGDYTGWLGLQYGSGSSYIDTKIFVNGYPKNVKGYNNPYKDQFTRAGTIKDAQSNILKSFDTFVSKGDSGGPCYIPSNVWDYMAIGITIREYDPYDGATWIVHAEFRLIDQSLYNKLIKFRTSTL